MCRLLWTPQQWLQNHGSALRGLEFVDLGALSAPQVQKNPAFCCKRQTEAFQAPPFILVQACGIQAASLDLKGNAEVASCGSRHRPNCSKKLPPSCAHLGHAFPHSSRSHPLDALVCLPSPPGELSDNYPSTHPASNWSVASSVFPQARW